MCDKDMGGGCKSTAHVTTPYGCGGLAFHGATELVHNVPTAWPLPWAKGQTDGNEIHRQDMSWLQHEGMIGWCKAAKLPLIPCHDHLTFLGKSFKGNGHLSVEVKTSGDDLSCPTLHK